MKYPDFKIRLNRLINDNTHGASYLTNKLFDIFIEANNSLSHSDYCKLVKAIDSWRPPMGDVLNVTTLIKYESANSTETNNRLLVNIQKMYSIVNQKTIDRAAKTIMKYRTIATLSYSSNVKESIMAAGLKGWRGRIMIAESRPILEGRDMAKALAGKSRKYGIILGTDCQILANLGEADAVFVGADLISKDFFINKIGTSVMAACLNPKKKMYIVAPTTKYYLKSADKIRLSERPSDEIWNNAPKYIKIINGYFERVKFAANMRFINQHGIWDSAKLQNYLEKSATLS